MAKLIFEDHLKSNYEELSKILRKHKYKFMGKGDGEVFIKPRTYQFSHTIIIKQGNWEHNSYNHDTGSSKFHGSGDSPELLDTHLKKFREE